MRVQPRWFWPAWCPILAGIAWLALGWRAGIVAGLFASLPGSLLLSSGMALLLWPGDRQISHYMALGGIGSLPLAVPMLFLAGPAQGLCLMGLSLASYALAGYAALYQTAALAGAPRPHISLRMACKVALDEATLAYFVGSAQIPTGKRVATDAEELRCLQGLVEASDWVAHPERFHREPEAPEHYSLRARRVAGETFLALRFASGYQPRPELPGGERWLGYAANRNVHAWVFRHPGAPRPWLVGVHGYRMGMPRIDFSLFPAAFLHHELGLNVILPTLPLHGLRAAYKRSGTGFLDGHLADILHAESQAMWDLRRVLAWLRREQENPRIAALGYSLGGYNAALLAALEPDLDCVVAAIPLADIADLVWRHLPLLHLRYIEAGGVTPALARAALAPVSPLALPCRVARERRFVLAATGDQLVPPGQPSALAAHWGIDCAWYQGSHLSIRGEAQARAFLADALGRCGLLDAGAGCPARAEAGQ